MNLKENPLEQSSAETPKGELGNDGSKLEMDDPELNKELAEDKEYFENAIYPEVARRLNLEDKDELKKEIHKKYNEIKKVKGQINDQVTTIIEQLERDREIGTKEVA